MRITQAALEMSLWGRFKKEVPKWHYVELPEGPQPVPAWCKGIHVDWHETYGSAPSFKLKVVGDARSWPDKRFELRGSNMWIAEHADGRAEVYYQTAVGMKRDKVKRFQVTNGALMPYRPDNLTPGKWVDIETMCTVQQQGFGGAHIDLKMIDGSEVTLRGPWAGGPPPGYTEVSYIDTTSRYYGWNGRKWYAQGGGGQLFIKNYVFKLIFARFAPHLRLAEVNEGLGFHLQPIDPNHGEPKAWRMQRPKLIVENFKWAALPKEEQPPFPSCGFPSLCKGLSNCKGTSKDDSFKDTHPSCERRSIDV